MSDRVDLVPEEFDKWLARQDPVTQARYCEHRKYVGVDGILRETFCEQCAVSIRMVSAS